ncbi:hypothetical protein ACFV83_31015, partial [Streptomyces pharetrae]
MRVKKTRKPPAKVLFKDPKVRELVAKAPKPAPIIGLGSAGRIMSVDLDADSPHILVNASTGGGKSALLRCIACQMLHHGSLVYVLDTKRISHPWAHGIDGVTYCRDNDIHDQLIELGRTGRLRTRFGRSRPMPLVRPHPQDDLPHSIDDCKGPIGLEPAGAPAQHRVVQSAASSLLGSPGHPRRAHTIRHMSIASPIPVLRSSGGTLLQFDDDALVLRRATEELRIPLRAIRRIRSEGRAVAVELTAPAGTAPAVHRIDDVSEAAVALFVDAVNAALTMCTEEADAVDGSTLVTARALTKSAEERRKRRRKIWAFAVGLFHFALSLAVGI